jgi:hypothetical protein
MQCGCRLSAISLIGLGLLGSFAVYIYIYIIVNKDNE